MVSISTLYFPASFYIFPQLCTILLPTELSFSPLTFTFPYLHILSLALDLLDTSLGDDSLLICHSHLSGEGAVRHPLAGCHWGSLLKHTIDLLQCETLGLRDQEVCVDEAENAERAPQEEDLGAEIDTTAGGGGNVWSHDCNDLEGHIS
jgi:hypothetical protein